MGATAHIYRTAPIEDVAETLRGLVDANVEQGGGDPGHLLASLSPAQIRRVLKGLHKGLRNKQIDMRWE